MSSLIRLSDKQELIQQACPTSQREPSRSVRASQKSIVYHKQLCQPRLSCSEEKVIGEGVEEFQKYRAPLT